MSSRRGRRRRERTRTKAPPRGRRLSPFARIGAIGVGVLLVVAGAVLLSSGSPGNAARLGRVAGILILVGIVAVVAGFIGRV